ncbi:MAG TPA: hypothetical protein VMT28_01775 [Terriglobales bacterium]|jgi:hypothetical protein|nr:hypothetical protein [Terriglobales bacterium]
MNTQAVRQGVRRVSLAVLPTLAVLALAAGFLAAQATISAGPLLLHQVKVIYVTPTSDDLAGLLKSHLERWGVVRITSQPEEADAILTCQTESRIVPAKVVVRWTNAEATLVDRRSQRPIWRTTKDTALDTNRLAEQIIEQLKKDWRKSASEF